MSIPDIDFWVERLYGDAVTINDYTFPLSDGAAGSIIQTDGAGTLSFVNGGYVVGPASATDEAIAVYDGTTGKLIKNSGATCNVAGEITSTGLTNAGLIYPTTDGTSGAVIVTDGTGNLSFASSIVTSTYAHLATLQSTDIGAGDHIKFDTVDYETGTGIAVDITTTYTTTLGVDSIGRITLNGGSNYCLVGEISSFRINNHSGSFEISWVNADTGTTIGSAVFIEGLGQNGGKDYTQPMVKVIVSPASTTRYELRITNPTRLNRIAGAWCEIKVV